MNENDFELAERQDQLVRDLGAKRAQAALAPQFHPNFDGEHCVGCGEPLPSVRLAMGRVRCTECQGREERKNGGTNHRV